MSSVNIAKDGAKINLRRAPVMAQLSKTWLTLDKKEV